MRRKAEKLRSLEATPKVELPADPVEFSEQLLGFKPTSYQEAYLRDSSKRILLRWARQTGKSLAVAAKAIWYAANNPGTLTLIVAPSLRQSMLLSDRVQDLLAQLRPDVRKRLVAKQQRTVIKFRNGSRIVALPNSENLLRGFTANAIVADEAAFFANDEEIFRNVLTPMLATTGGSLTVSSTPWGKNSVFYELNNDPRFSKHVATWTDALKAGVYKPEAVEEIKTLERLRPEKYRMEYQAEFIDDVDSWLSQDLLAKSIDANLSYLDFQSEARGAFYVGCDFGKAQDYTVIAVVERREDASRLIHLHRFPLGTAYASTIGYVKALSDRWRTVHAVWTDITGVGDYITEDMRNAGLPGVRGLTFTVAEKENLAQVLRDRMSRGLFRIPYDRELIDELNAERYELSKTGHVQFSHPEGTHDDRFWAVALAVAAVPTAEPSFALLGGRRD
ncbi:MAG: terminase family protein [Candidatus Bathyarchaeia archaeon]